MAEEKTRVTMHAETLSWFYMKKLRDDGTSTWTNLEEGKKGQREGEGGGEE